VSVTDRVAPSAIGSETELLGGLPLFAGLPSSTLVPIFQESRIERHRPGALLCREGECSGSLTILISGIVELSKVEGSRSCGILILSAGDLIMPTAALFDEPFLTSARALSPVRVATVPAPLLLHEAEQSPELALRLARVAGGQWRMAIRHLLDLKCRNAAERLAAFLLRLVDGGPLPDSAVLPIPKRDLAARVGVTPETLSRLLQTLAGHGLFVRGSRILVRDREQIEAFCGPDPYPEKADESLEVFAL